MVGGHLAQDFVSAEEEAALMAEVEPHLKRLVYEKDHWDEVQLFKLKALLHLQFILCFGPCIQLNETSFEAMKTFLLCVLKLSGLDGWRNIHKFHSIVSRFERR